MRKFILVLISLSALAANAQRTWDQPVQIQSCSIKVEANLFVAKTVIELEFYNPNNNSVEGIKNFKLDTGLAITGFELELNGKFRKGSIEQSSKAAQAYNAIVGKRVDPALLQMTGDNYYTLRIFPFDPKGTRKIRFTIHQLMKSKKDAVEYFLPLAFTDSIRKFTTSVHAYGISLAPRDPGGIITDAFFHFTGSEANLLYERRNIIANQPVVFELPLAQASVTCFGKKQGTTWFATRYLPAVTPSYPIEAKTLTVFWDVSASGSNRQVDKEINFLKQYVALHKPSELEIICFNYKIRSRNHFTAGDRSWINFLKNLVYDGGTQIGCIDLSQVRSEVTLLFTDGINGYGNAQPRAGSGYVFSVHATSYMNKALLAEITRPSGGSDIDLLTTNLSDAVKTASAANVALVDIYSASGRTIIDSSTSTTNGVVFIGGTTEVASDTLLLVYGNSVREKVTASIILNQARSCNDSSITMMKTLADFAAHVARRNYTNDFGLTEKIVTYTTAYIVLEKPEDYVRYGIEPPDELMEECIQKGYVKTQPATQVVIDQVAAVTNQFNGRTAMLDAKIPVDDRSFMAPAGTPQLEEVVVTTAMGVRRKQKEVGYSTATIKTEQLGESKTFNLADAMTGKVSGLVIQHNTADVNAKPKINLRGLRSLTGNNSPLIVLDGVPVKESVIQTLNPNDVNTITVLKGGQAATLFGSEGVNGAIVIEMKKGSAYSRLNANRQYKLSAMEDVDYLTAIKSTTKQNKRTRYEQLKAVYRDDPGFYIDMADHFYSEKLYDDAFDILTNATEKANGSFAILNAIAYTLETWHWWDSANLFLKDRQFQKVIAKRAIAWNLFRGGYADQAVKMLNEMIEQKEENIYAYNSVGWKAFLLGEMNSMIHSSDKPVNVSYIRKDWIKPQAADLRIVVEMNNGGYLPVSITEPNSNASYNGVSSRIGGMVKYENLGDAYLTDYILPVAAKGKYRINVHYNSNGWQYTQMGKLTIFRNYGRKNQTIETQSFILDNQSGIIEIAAIKI